MPTKLVTSFILLAIALAVALLGARAEPPDGGRAVLVFGRTGIIVIPPCR